MPVYTAPEEPAVAPACSADVAANGEPAPSEVSSPSFGFVTRRATGALKNRAQKWRRRESNRRIGLGTTEPMRILDQEAPDILAICRPVAFHPVPEKFLAGCEVALT